MAHIDWVTIVGRRRVDEKDWSTTDAYVTAADWLIDLWPTFKEAVGSPVHWGIVKPRAPYSYARRTDDCTRTLYVHPLSTHFTLEISGGHCQRMNGLMPSMLHAYAGHFSRIDLAVDMESAVTPIEFEEACKGGQALTSARMTSRTGQTVYIGSRTSERFARVYRYNPPHPRAHLLRAEFQLKGAYANKLAEHIAEGETLESYAAGLGKHFGFTHECWKPSDKAQVLRVQSHAQTGQTVAWLTSTVAPLLKRLDREGKLDVQMWFQEYVVKELGLYD